MDTFSAIDRLKATLDQHRPLDPAIVRNLREDLILRWTYHSNAIEGNTLTLRETKVALEGITVGGKTLREHLEAVNHRDAILLLEDIWYRTEAMALHPVERAARVHSDFVKIHPFVDGNGRTSRLLMNLELMKAGYPAAVLPVESRLAYYEALDADHVDGNRKPFVMQVANIVREGFQPFFHALGLEWHEADVFSMEEGQPPLRSDQPIPE